MIGSVIEIIDNHVKIKLAIDINKQPNLVGLHVVFEDADKRIVGEIVSVNQVEMLVVVVGEVTKDSFVPGSAKRPSFRANIRLVTLEELELMLGSQNVDDGETNIGVSNIYDGYRINVNINDFFSNHFSVLGNSGAGKSCTVASIVQKLFMNPKTPISANFFFFDAFGE